MSRFSRNLLLMFVVTIILLTAIASTSQERPALTFPEKILRDVLAPLQTSVTTVTNRVTGFFEGMWSYTRLKKDNQELIIQVEKLQQKVNQLEVMQYENIRLREALGFDDGTKEVYDLEPAQVVARDPRNWFSTITINRGKSDGVEKDMPVVTKQGLVGRTIAVSDHTASVLLILDNRSAVGALIHINNSPGIVEGLNDKAGFVRMIHIPRDAVVKPNQKVFTSGLSSFFPKALLIGRIVEVRNEASGLLQQAIVRPYVDFDRLDNVFVIKKVFTPPVVNKEGGQS